MIGEIFSLVGFNFNIVFNWQNVFLICVGLFWLLIASVQDFKHREVENWWSFSLIVFVLAFRAFVSLSDKNILFFVWGLGGLLLGFAISELLYYARMYGGGDSKLLMALGVILPLSLDWRANLFFFFLFVMLFIFSGAIYGAVYSLILTFFNLKEFKKKFADMFLINKKITYLSILLGIVLVVLFLSMDFLFGLVFAGILIFSPFLFIYAKAIEESCMNKSVNVADLTIGDWLSKPLKIKGRVIKPYWEGLSEKELIFVQKNYKKKVEVKYGIPFVPAFFIAFVIFIILLYLL